MNDEVEAHYPIIGQMMADLLPDDFEEAFVSFEGIDDVWSTELFYRREGGHIGYLNDGLEGIEGNLRSMRTLLKEAGQEPFSTATFTLHSSGKFSIDLGYEDVSDLGQGAKRREDWIKKYLGADAQIDWS